MLRCNLIVTMKNTLFLLPALLIACTLHAEPVVIGEDDASQGSYNNGWNGDTNGGSGFEPWVIMTTREEGTESNAGLFIATREGNKDFDETGINDKAFGMYANGKSFEVSAAFRQFARPLTAGDTFSFLMKTGPFKTKFDFDSPDTGAIGITLRAASGAAKTDDYKTEVRFEFGTYEGQANYQIYDGETSHDSGIPVSEAPLTVTFTLVTPDTYELEIMDFASKKTTKLDPRKLGGAPTTPLVSFCLFDRDGETHNAYFNGFQIAKPAQ